MYARSTCPRPIFNSLSGHYSTKRDPSKEGSQDTLNVGMGSRQKRLTSLRAASFLDVSARSTRRWSVAASYFRRCDLRLECHAIDACLCCSCFVRGRFADLYIPRDRFPDAVPLVRHMRTCAAECLRPRLAHRFPNPDLSRSESPCTRSTWPGSLFAGCTTLRTPRGSSSSPERHRSVARAIFDLRQARDSPCVGAPRSEETTSCCFDPKS